VITPAHVEHAFASRHVALHRYAHGPELCDRAACSGVEIWGGKLVYLAATPKRADYLVVVLPTVHDAVRIAKVRPGAVVRRQNALLMYVASARARLAPIFRIFSSL
jgi:hypothetical protein